MHQSWQADASSEWLQQPFIAGNESIQLPDEPAAMKGCSTTWVVVECRVCQTASLLSSCV